MNESQHPCQYSNNRMFISKNCARLTGRKGARGGWIQVGESLESNSSPACPATEPTEKKESV